MRKGTKKQLTKKATLKQRKALKHALENGGKLGPAMKAAGYSKAMAKNPQKLKESDGWKALMEGMGLNDLELLKISKRHTEAKQLKTIMVDPMVSDIEIKEVLQATGATFLRSVVVEVTFTNKKGEEKTFEKKEVFYSAPDTHAQDRALDKLYKIRGAYKPELDLPGVAVQINNVLSTKKEAYGI